MDGADRILFFLREPEAVMRSIASYMSVGYPVVAASIPRPAVMLTSEVTTSILVVVCSWL